MKIWHDTVAQACQSYTCLESVKTLRSNVFVVQTSVLFISNPTVAWNVMVTKTVLASNANNSGSSLFSRAVQMLETVFELLTINYVLNSVY